MVVCMSRRICVALYNEIVKLRPGWHSGDDNRGAIKVVMTGNASDPPSWQPHIGTPQKARCELLAKRIKEPDDHLKLVLVRDMWLTGFDAPRNTVLYICKLLKEHNLLQAIARVNRLHEDGNAKQEKQFGFILDYEGLLGEPDRALTTYSAFGNYDPADLQGTVHDIREEIRRLPQLHEQLWDLFKPVRNKRDMEQLEQHLGDDSIREAFYERLRAFSRCLHICLSSDNFWTSSTRNKLMQ